MSKGSIFIDKNAWRLASQIYRLKDVWSIGIHLGFAHSEIDKTYNKFENNALVTMMDLLYKAYEKDKDSFENDRDSFEKVVKEAFDCSQILGIYEMCLQKYGRLLVTHNQKEEQGVGQTFYV